jgi:ribonucleoside-diphosphate reductase alpha chain
VAFGWSSGSLAPQQADASTGPTRLFYLSRISRTHRYRTRYGPVNAAAQVEKIVYRPLRRKLDDERHAVTHKFSVGGHEGYITVGLYDDGQPGELFITMAKEGSTISGLKDGFATAASFTLQYGVPLKFLVDKFSHVRFEPSGWTGNQQVPYAKSILDYIFRWMGAKFLGPEYAPNEAGDTTKLRPTEPEPQQSLPFGPVVGDAPICSECCGLMTRNGACFKCENCGGTILFTSRKPGRNVTPSQRKM